MTQEEKNQLLAKAQNFFRRRIVPSHFSNTKKLRDYKELNVNPFLLKYLSQFAFGDSSPENMAKALIYPRVLGTSITTSFGTHIQYFCNDVLSAYVSKEEGIDIEFDDALDGRHKYCQIKAGPVTINRNDITVIKNKFYRFKDSAKEEGRTIDDDDCIIGVFYGNLYDLCKHYLSIHDEYHVYIGKYFWQHLTGDPDFYDALISTFAEVASEMDCTALLDDILRITAKHLEKEMGK